jgi:predicted lipoprotein with Yx(FWY)xxD motif
MNRKIVLGFSGVTLVLLAFAGWSSPLIAAGPDASVATTSLGKIIVDGKGMTAYFFDRDTPNTGSSSCAGPCTVNWPAITSATTVPTVVGITGSVGTIAATKQITINGRPIYTYLFDTVAGATNGQGVGGVWFVISAPGEELKSAKPLKKTKPLKRAQPTIKATIKPTVSPTAQPTDTAIPYDKSNY